MPPALAGYLRPYDLISRLLIRHGGRMALLARLGPEAEDGIDELLSQAMAYEQAETPSLTGFLVWLASDEVQVKRQLPGGSGGLIRVMTVHGAKGLESPIVILPETRKRRADGRGRIVRLDGMPAWKGAAPDRPDALTIAVAEQERRQDEERRRLLYVAMTRAESWLIVAAAGETGAGLDSWHGMITDGAARAALPRSPIEIEGVGQGTRLTFGAWPEWADAAEAQSAAATPRPAWLACVPEPVARPPRPVAATGLGGAKVLAAATDDSDPAAATAIRI